MSDVFYLPGEMMSAFKIFLDGSVLHKETGKALPGIRCELVDYTPSSKTVESHSIQVWMEKGPGQSSNQ